MVPILFVFFIAQAIQRNADAKPKALSSPSIRGTRKLFSTVGSFFIIACLPQDSATRDS